jgi:uncharacterized protein (DUF1697 family)
MKYTLLLRGINVGGHHKVPMAALREILQTLGCTHVKTLLNSGNAVFEHEAQMDEAGKIHSHKLLHTKTSACMFRF